MLESRGGGEGSVDPGTQAGSWNIRRTLGVGLCILWSAGILVGVALAAWADDRAAVLRLAQLARTAVLALIILFVSFLAGRR